jgi:hypothetical protein
MTDTKLDMSKLTIPASEATKYSFTQPPNNIIFYNNLGGEQVEVLRITKEGITANPNVPTDEAASAVIRALDGYIKNLSNRNALLDEVADEIEKFHPAFGKDTVYSFAAFVRNMKK